MARCARMADHRLPAGKQYSMPGCQHRKAESMTRYQFAQLELVRCIHCQTALGRVCPECNRVY